MKPIFQKNLQFGDIWPQNRQKIAQVKVSGHFLDFSSLVFPDFAHNDRWAWCLVIFLQFVGPVDVFLLIPEMNTSRKGMEWLICFPIIKLMLGCLLSKKIKKIYESCSLSKAARMSSTYRK